MGMPVVLQAFAYEPKYLTNYNFELVMVLDENWWMSALQSFQ